MTAHPFFSVVNPTKSRPTPLQDAIQSVLLQDFDDYELIVSNNFDDERTRQVVEPFLGHPRADIFAPKPSYPCPIIGSLRPPRPMADTSWC